jgi:hypothetical protein
MKRRVLFIAVFALVVIAIFWRWSSANRGPLHSGKPISYWVNHACLDPNANTNTWEFCEEVQKIGAPALPYLISKLQTGEGLRKTYRSLRAPLPAWLQKHLPNVRTGLQVRQRTATVTGMLGTNAAPAVPYLTRLLPGTDVSVISALMEIGPAAKNALPALHSALTDKSTDAHQRLAIADALWKIGRETNTVLEICTNAIVRGPTDAEVMNGCAFMIQLGKAAAPAAPFALAVLQSTNHSASTRGNAAAILGVAQISTPDILAALLEGTKAEETGTAALRFQSGLALWALDSQYAPLGTRLMVERVVAMKKRNPGYEPNVLDWLEFRNLDFKQGIPTLKELLQSNSAEIRNEAAAVLKTIEAKTQPAVNP